MKIRHLTALFALLPFLWAHAGYKIVQAPLPDDPMQVHIYELDNGLKVYLTENHQSPTFRSEITVRAGSKHDPEHATGLAHYLEHLLFKGNTKLGSTNWEEEKKHIERIEELYEQHYHAEDPEERQRIYQQINEESQEAAQYAIPSEFDALISSMGGSGINAYTAPDRTVYIEEMPANRLEQWAILESNRFSNPVFRLFQPELEIVYEEKNRSLDNKDRILSEALFELMYGEHPYGSQTALGSVEHLKRPSLKTIHEFFDKYYVANNMAVALSGDFEAEKAIEIIDEHFSSWRSGEVPEFDRPMPPPIDEKKSVTVEYPGEEQVVIGFDTAPVGHEDVEPLKLIDMILDNASAGLINLNLNQQQRVQQAGTYPYLRNDAGSQFLWGIPKSGQTLEEVEQLLLEQLDLIKQGKFADWIVPAIITDFKKSEKLSMESNEGRLRMISTSFGEYQDWERVVREIERIEKVDKETIMKVANKYFDGPYVVAYRRDGPYTPPSVPKPDFDHIEIDRTRRSEFGMKILSMDVDPIAPTFLVENEDYQVMELADGVRLFYVENPVNDLFALSKVYEMGSLEMRKLPMAAALLDKSGTKNRQPGELKRDWYKIGSEFSFSVGEHTTSVSVSGLEENFDESMELFQEVLNKSKGEAETLEQLKAIQLKQMQDAKKDPTTIFNALRNYSRYREESPFLTSLSTDEIKAMTVDELIALVNSLSHYKHDYLYVGQMPVQEVAEKLRAAMPREGKMKRPPELQILSIREPESNEIVYVDYETAQSQIRIEFPDGTYQKDLQPEIEMFNEYFYGGMAGIVFQEMREARALAYAVWAHYLVSQFDEAENLVMGYIGTQADKTSDALDAYLQLWNDMPESKERFAVAIASLDNQYRVNKLGFRQIPGAVKAWERQGIKEDPRPDWYNEIKDSTLEDVMEFYNSRIRGEAKLISILGPSSAIDLDRAKQFGSFEQISVDDIFVK